jgi:hypothetical protein
VDAGAAPGTIAALHQGVLPRSSNAARLTTLAGHALLACLLTATAQAQEPAPPPQSLAVGAMPDAPDWIRASDVARLALSRTLTADDGSIAVLIGDTDWSGLSEVSGTTLSIRPAGVGFPQGEHTIAVYHVDTNRQWVPIGQSTLKVLTAGGFEKAVATPTVEVGLTGQAALERTPAQPRTDRDTFQDFSLRAGIETTHVRNGWTTTSQAQMVGVDCAPQALRYGTLRDDAPLVDLGSYQFGIRNSTVSFNAGHTTIGSHRMLLNGFQTRGVAGTLRLGRVVDVSAAAANGSTIVGYDNLFGLADGEHRVVNATVGLELVPSRRGALRVEGLVMNGSVLPITNVNQGAVRDPEESTGLGLQVRASDARARFVLDAGLARSRFTNPLDPQAPSGLAVVPVQETTRDARFLDVSYAFLQGAKLGETATANLTAAYRHSRVDPLFRSVALPVRADLEQHAVDVTTALGAFTSQVTFDASRDNLAGIGSILTTQSRQVIWTNALPLQTFAAGSTRAAAWPTLSYTLNRMHQYGEDLPDGGLFDSASQVPDQMSTNQALGVAWQGAVWRGGYAWNRSLQDNRQPGRERADLLNVIHTFTVGAMASTRLDAGVELAFEDADNQEIHRTDITRRVSFNVMVRPFSPTSVAAVITRNWLEDNPSTFERRTTDVNLTFTQDVALWRSHPQRMRGQFFLRYVRQTIYGLLLGVVSPDNTQFWTLNTGLTFRFF